MKCKIKLEPGAILPVKNKKNDNCYDIFSNEYHIVNQGMTCVINTGVKVSPESGWGIAVRPRSGKSMKGIILGGGEIDNGYRGEIGVIIHNFTGEKLTIEKGEKIAQIRPIRIEDVDFEIVDKLDDTDRGESGFGSSGE